MDGRRRERHGDDAERIITDLQAHRQGSRKHRKCINKAMLSTSDGVQIGSHRVHRAPPSASAAHDARAQTGCEATRAVSGLSAARDACMSSSNMSSIAYGT
eukprot:320949-Pleurochrysis_carterae.AAC.4